MESPISSLPPISSVLSPSPPESSSDGTESTASSQPYDEDALDALMGRCEHLSARLAAYEREPAARPRGAAISSSNEPGDSVASSITNDFFPAPEPVEMPPKKRQRRRRKGRKHARDAAGFEGRSP